MCTTQRLKEDGGETITEPPKIQKFDRKETLEKEHKHALERAVTLNIPHAVMSADDEYSEEGSSQSKNVEPCIDGAEQTSEKEKSSPSDARTNWNQVVEKLFNKNESGKLLLKTEVSAVKSDPGSADK